MTRTHLAAVAVVALLFAAPSTAQDAKKKEKKQDDETALTLENLFPEKGLFGPSPRRPEFSHDGRYALWLHKPYVERRHGSDLYLLDVRSGKVERLTSVPVMAKFQESTRKVLEDREERAKKRKQDAAPKKNEAKKKPKVRASAENMHVDELVGLEDADDEKAPRYGGISSFVWAPKANEFLFGSGGDVYHYEVTKKTIERLTKTKESEGSVDYLPDGSGYTYMRNGGLIRVRFDSHLIEQLDPKFESGESLTGYELSPDGKRAVFVTRKGASTRTGGRTVKIARYRDRFMQVQEVPRHVSDDPIGKGEARIYLYDLGGALEEKGPLYKIHTFENTGPRDVVRTPEWAPDSSRVVFAVYAQDGGQVHILESEFPTGEEGKADGGKKAEAKKKETDEKKSEGDDEKDEAKKKPEWIVDRPARIVYRFLHAGGPTTPRMIEPVYLADSRHLLFLSEQSGFRHLHVLDPVYESVRQLTSGHFEVYPLELSEDRKHVFVSATKEHPSRLDVYQIALPDGAMERLTKTAGTYRSAAVSDDGRHVLGTFAAFGAPRELVHVQPARGRQTVLTDSHPDKAWHFTQAKPEFFSYENRHDQAIHGFLFKPEGWRKSGKWPLLIYVYGGPLGTSKQVVEGNFGSDAYLFAWYLAQKHGFVACTIDPRGMSGYGAVYEKANYEQVGKPQVEDLVDGVKHLIENFGVDPERVGIHGWSFGGFQTQMCMYTEPDVFKVGIAGAGPTEWHNYNSWYSTGTIGPSREGKTDLDKYSLLPLAKNLEGKLLLVHGMEDSNVLYQDTVRVYRELLKAGKEALVELFLDPTGGHGLGGDIERLNRAREYEEFLLRTLGDGAPARASGRQSSGKVGPGESGNGVLD